MLHFLICHFHRQLSIYNTNWDGKIDIGLIGQEGEVLMGRIETKLLIELIHYHFFIIFLISFNSFTFSVKAVINYAFYFYNSYYLSKAFRLICSASSLDCCNCSIYVDSISLNIPANCFYRLPHSTAIF